MLYLVNDVFLAGNNSDAPVNDEWMNEWMIEWSVVYLVDDVSLAGGDGDIPVLLTFRWIAIERLDNLHRKKEEL